jgi:hypothetical protein
VTRAGRTTFSRAAAIAALEEALRIEPGFRPAKQALDSLARRE